MTNTPRTSGLEERGDAREPAIVGASARAQLKTIVERIERLQEEKKGIGDDIADVYREAKANGFDVKALREVVRLRGQDSDTRSARAAVLEAYMHALGML